MTACFLFLYLSYFTKLISFFCVPALFDFLIFFKNALLVKKSDHASVLYFVPIYELNKIGR